MLDNLGKPARAESCRFQHAGSNLAGLLGVPIHVNLQYWVKSLSQPCQWGWWALGLNSIATRELRIDKLITKLWCPVNQAAPVLYLLIGHFNQTSSSASFSDGGLCSNDHAHIDRGKIYFIFENLDFWSNCDMFDHYSDYKMTDKAFPVLYFGLTWSISEENTKFHKKTQNLNFTIRISINKYW